MSFISTCSNRNASRKRKQCRYCGTPAEGVGGSDEIMGGDDGGIPGNAERGWSRDISRNNFLYFLDHFISTFSNRNGYDKFQLLK